MRELSQMFLGNEAIAGIAERWARNAFFHEHPAKRELSLALLDSTFNYGLLEGIIDDNQCFLKVKVKDGSVSDVYICDLPKLPSGEYTPAYNFCLRKAEEVVFP